MDILNDNYSGAKCGKDLYSDEADKSWGSYGYLNQEANDNPINRALLNPLLNVKNLRLSNVNSVIIDNLNIKLLTNKYDQVVKYIDVLVITETKRDHTFPSAHNI